MLYLILLFLSGPSLGQARRLAWTKRPKKIPILKRLFLRIYPMIHRSKTTILLLKRDLLMPQVLSINPQAPSRLRNPPVQQSLLTSQQPQCKPAIPRMMRLSLLALAILSQTTLSLYPSTVPKKNLLLQIKASGRLTCQVILISMLKIFILDI